MKQKTGIWFVGACGNIATLVQAGILLLKAGRARPAGILTETELVKGADLPGYDEFVFGGCETKKPDFRQSLLYLSGFIPTVKNNCRFLLTNLNKTLKNISRGIANETGPGDIGHVRAQIRKFAKANSLCSVIVINVASTEPMPSPKAVRLTLKQLEQSISSNRKTGLPVSSLYAFAAIAEKSPYINFTPSAGSSLPCITEFALRERVPHMGRDGKTGETLLKSLLAAMFVMRDLEVKSWSGYNILGTEDGRNLDLPQNKTTKISTKQGIIEKILGYGPDTKVGIDFVPSLGGWKIAWDYVQFNGFLDTEMAMQFVWQGRDTALAAPLIIDLARLMRLSQKRGEFGTLPHLSMFFKSPAGCDANALPEQFELLKKYLRTVNSGQ
ncbi:MAG: inositol-3-phosphate synthase [Planctomycetes bacterium]|nr:inositol-3-phosphate synthase [Planctomycetota bacterium]